MVRALFPDAPFFSSPLSSSLPLPPLHPENSQAQRNHIPEPDSTTQKPIAIIRKIAYNVLNKTVGKEGATSRSGR